VRQGSAPSDEPFCASACVLTAARPAERNLVCPI